MYYTAPEIATMAIAAGFRGESLITMIATSIGESGGNAAARGDTTITDAKWGPSIGLTQIRSLNAERGRGTTRDEQANLDPWTNLRHAFEISNKGTNFQPWSVFTSGKYKAHLNVARLAAAAPAKDVKGGTGAIGGGPDATRTQIDMPDIVGAIRGVSTAIEGVGKGVKGVGDLASKAMWFALPSSWLRIASAGFGIAFIFIGLTMLGKEVRDG